MTEILTEAERIPESKERLMCHFTEMEYSASDYEEWLECKHCGHIQLISQNNDER